MTFNKSRQRRRETPAPPLSRAQELLAIEKFIAKHGATRPHVHALGGFEGPRKVNSGVGFLRTDGRVGRTVGWTDGELS